jgi:hypothetical protein
MTNTHGATLHSTCLVRRLIILLNIVGQIPLLFTARVDGSQGDYWYMKRDTTEMTTDVGQIKEVSVCMHSCVTARGCCGRGHNGESVKGREHAVKLRSVLRSETVFRLVYIRLQYWSCGEFVYLLGFAVDAGIASVCVCYGFSANL